MFFDKVNEAKPDPIFGLLGTFREDPRKQKVNLMVGIYKDDNLKAELINSSRKAQEQILKDEIVADYLPIDGMGEMVALLGPVIFGDANWKSAQDRIYGAHTTGGTGALRVGAEFLLREVTQAICIPNHTWPNHRSVFEHAGCKVENYPYYNREKGGFDLDAMLAYLRHLPEKTAVLLHACCHNPTGCDPSIAQWNEISRVMKEKHLLPFFDFAYQGLGDGIEKDAESVRIFLRDGHEMLIAYSCSKNFSMYCQRVGALFVIDGSSTVKLRVGSQIKTIIRALYSNPPAHGARIVCEVLKNQELRQLWLKDLEGMRRRLNMMRESLIQRLVGRAKHLNFETLRSHKGMFSFIDLDKTQVQKLIDKFAIYLTDNGRISVAGLTTKNINYVVNSLASVCEEQ